MPAYDYKCSCGWVGELSAHVRDRRNQVCPDCKNRLGAPVINSAPSYHGPGYQMKAVLGDGQHLKGHFGKDAKRDRGGRKK